MSRQGLSYQDTQQLYKELEKLKVFIERDQEENRSLREQLEREKLVKLLANAPQNFRSEMTRRLQQIKLEVQRVVSNDNSNNVNMPSTVRLVYFNGRGRAEHIRLMLAALNIKFEHVGVSTKEEWNNVRNRQSCTYKQVPILEMDDESVVQSGAIVRYIGSRFNLYPRRSDYANVGRVEEIIEAVSDFMKPFGPFQFHNDKKKLQNELDFDRYLPRWENYLNSNSNCRFVNNQLTVADLMVYAALETYVSGVGELDKETFGNYPNLCKLYNQIDKMGRIQAYKEERKSIIASTEDYRKQLKATLNLNL